MGYTCPATHKHTHIHTHTHTHTHRHIHIRAELDYSKLSRQLKLAFCKMLLLKVTNIRKKFPANNSGCVVNGKTGTYKPADLPEMIF